jgi:hypothetical protein
VVRRGYLTLEPIFSACPDTGTSRCFAGLF